MVSTLERPVSASRVLSPRAHAALDLVRALAALYVVAYHIATYHTFPGSGTFRFGQEAVLAFFLLSGFVVYANERDRAQRPRGYYLRRIRRIYPPLFFAFAVSTLVFTANGTLAKNFSLGSLFGSIFALQDVSALKPGVITDPYLGNSPLWSLSYELFFYLVFPLLIRLPERWATHLVGGVAVAGYATYLLAPNHFSLVAAYLLVWWAGAMLARAYLRGDRLDLRAIKPEAAWLLALISVSMAGVAWKGRHGIGFFPELQTRHFVIGLVFLALSTTPVAGAVAAVAYRVRRPVAWVAGISYGLYVVHYSLVVQWNESKHRPGLALAIVLAVAGAYVCERLLPRVIPRAPRD